MTIKGVFHQAAALASALTHTSASWINQGELFFGLLIDDQIRRGMYRFVREFEAAIAYIKTHDDGPGSLPKTFVNVHPFPTERSRLVEVYVRIGILTKR